MKNMKRAGTARENQVKRLLEADGWVVMRAPASIGAADLIALKAGHPARFVQVKAVKGGPFKTFGPADRLELVAVARQAGGVPELCWWPPHGECQWLSHATWPLPTDARAAA